MEKNAGFTPEERANFETFIEEHKFVDTFREARPYERKYSFWSARARARPVNNGWRLVARPVNNGWRLDYNLIDS